MEMFSLKGWAGIGRPPQIAQQQYAQLWHYEFALRHAVFGSLRLKYGRDWEKPLEMISTEFKERETLRTFAHALRKKAIGTKEFDEQNCPNAIWFTTLSQLFSIIQFKDLWQDCFHDSLRPLIKDDVENVKNALIRARNRWGHFRPLSAEYSEETFELFRSAFAKPLIAWMARYWNAELCAPNSPIVELSQKTLRNSVPLVQTASGSNEYSHVIAELGSGWALSIYESDEKDCYWIVPHALGLQDVYSVQDAARYARELRDRIGHVAVVFDPFTTRGELESKGLMELRISIPKADSESDVVKTIEKIAEITKDRLLQSWVPGEESPAAGISDYIDWVFFNCPHNVLIAPTQEETKAFRVLVNEPPIS